MTIVPQEQIVDNTPPLGFDFAQAVDVSGNTMVVGQRVVPNPNQLGGRALVYESLDGVWTLVQTLVPSDAEDFLRFGAFVAVDGDTMLVGAPFTGDFGIPTGPGAIYVFEHQGGTWVEVQKIQGNYEGFGQQFALSGDRAIIHSVDSDGGLFTYQRVNGEWVVDQELVPTGFGPTRRFGGSFDIDGDRAVVSAFGSFKAIIFDRIGGSWVETARVNTDLFDESGDSISFFGVVSLDGDVLALGVPQSGTDHGAFNSGGVSMYRKVGSSWTHEADLSPSVLGMNNYFGGSIGLDGDLMVVGSDFFADDLFHSGAGFVFAYRDGSWQQVEMIVSPEPQFAGNFGDSVALNGSHMLVAAPGETVMTSFGVPGHGALYPFNVVGPCPADLTGDMTLDFFDVARFLDLFAADDPAADLTGDGLFDFFDVAAYLRLFSAGCP